MSDIILDNRQRLLYYHLIDYSKIVLIIEKALKLSCCESESSISLQLISAFDAVQDKCVAACNWYGASVNDPTVIRDIRSQLSSSQLSELGVTVFQDIMNITNPLLALLRCNSQCPEEVSQKLIIKEMLFGVLSSVQQMYSREKKGGRDS